MEPTCMACGALLELKEHYYVVFPDESICLDCLHLPCNVLIYNFLKDVDALSPEDIVQITNQEE